MGELGVGVLCYNFTPQGSKAAMAVQTTNSFAERGGALTSQFRLADFREETVPHKESPTSDEQKWDNLEYFLKK